MKFYSVIDIEMGLKRFVYRLFNNASGQPLFWDRDKRRYVAHMEMPHAREDSGDSGLDLADWIGYGRGSDWGSPRR